ncbi:MAG: histidine kinase [Chitinophagaceae bacterium]
MSLTLVAIMIWPFQNKTIASYWLKVFVLYALIEACIQLMFYFILNNFGTRRISIIEYHLVMWLFQCLLIWFIWWVAWSVRQKKLVVQILGNIFFYVIYSYCWFGPVQDAIAYLYNNFQEITRPVNDRAVPFLDRGNEYSFLNYQLLKHAFRLSWFFLAAYFYNYRLEERKRMELAVANKELQLKSLKWHLNPSFYFKTINHLRKVAAEKPMNAIGPILQLAKVMEYVIYEAKEKLIDVKKEIQFLTNYIQLINRQTDDKVKFELDVAGQQDKLKIAPLILTGFIDKMASEDNMNGETVYKIHLHFSGNEMRLLANGTPVTTGVKKRTALPLSRGDDLYKRLAELYPDRFSFSYAKNDNQFKLSIKLDEER